MPINWFRGQKVEEDPDNNQGEIKPEQFKAELATEFDNKFKSFKEENDKTLSPLLEMAKAFAENKRIAEENRAKEQNKNREESLEVDEDLWITNPGEANRRANANIARQSMGTAAILMRRETLDKLPYYDGDIKNKVDALIEKQPLEHRANPELLRNAYYSVVGQHSEEIREGKIKQQTFGANFNGTGTGGRTGESQDSPRSFSAEEKALMARFGMTEKDVEKGEQELNYV